MIVRETFFVFPNQTRKRFGFKGKVFFCLKHYEETKNPTTCCFPWRSDNDKCSERLVICPQRLVKVFEAICPAKTYSKICRECLKKAANDEIIIGNKHYTSARKVSSGEKFIARVIPVSLPYLAKASYRDFMVFCHCYY